MTVFEDAARRWIDRDKPAAPSSWDGYAKAEADPDDAVIAGWLRSFPAGTEVWVSL